MPACVPPSLRFLFERCALNEKVTSPTPAENPASPPLCDLHHYGENGRSPALPEKPMSGCERALEAIEATSVVS
jgi:hypothetical protein